MDEEREKATELLKSGKYYAEALKWYNARYTTPKTQLACAVVFAAIAIVFLFTSMVTTISILPLTYKEEFDLYREITPTESVELKEIGEKGENSTRVWLKYMLSEYVKAREEYDPNHVERNFNFVASLSSDEKFMDYMILADQNQNPNHPIWLYGSQAIKDIFISKTVFNDLDRKLKNFEANKEYSVTINFISSLLFVDNMQTQERHQAEIKFIFQPIILDQKTNKIKQLPSLVVTDYKTKKLDNL